MAFDLNPVAVTAAPLLRALQAGGWTSKKELAERAGRHPNHIQRDLKMLADNGLVADADPFPLTEQGAAQLAALDRAADPTGGGAPSALHGDLEPHPLNPRKDFETAEAEEALEELRVSIVKSGLLQPIVVRPRPEPGKWWIVAGERRWRAIGQAISDGDWDEDRPIPITIRDVDDRDHLLLALNENLQRSNMKSIEEGVAFAAAVQDFGLSTEELANRTGKSQRYVQQRIALLKLPEADQDRMRLPKDHPDFLSFKAARALTQTPRAPEPAPTLGQQVAELGAAVMATGEPGSPPAEDEAARFGRSLNDREALAFVEIIDKAERHPAADPALAAEGYTEVADARDPVRDALVQKGLIAIRYRGSETPHARAYLMTSGARAWLEEIGFYDPVEREDLLREFRARIVGIENAISYGQAGVYATKWLNPPPGASQDGRPLPEIKPTLEPRPAEAQSGALDLDQPALIEESAEEREARQAAERERAAVAADREVAERLSDEVVRALAEARAGAKPFGDIFAGDGSHEGLDALLRAAFGALSLGEPELACAALGLLIKRGGSMGARYTMQRLSLPEIEAAMLKARVDRQTAPVEGLDAAEPDPVEDFVQAELPEGEDEHADSDADLPTGEARREPAVPIRRSITPDHIVCLEDGRKFKSLKRHLRTRYNLSPEEYRAKWGLPADYPMVAPNYAKARAELARQMGLEDRS